MRIISLAPSTFTQPEVFYEDADLYEEDGGQIPSVKIDAERDLHELAELARLAQAEASSAPTVTLLDNGLLLYFSLQTQDQKLIEAVLRDYLSQSLLKRHRVLNVAGGADIIDRLEIDLSPHDLSYLSHSLTVAGKDKTGLFAARFGVSKEPAFRSKKLSQPGERFGRIAFLTVYHHHNGRFSNRPAGCELTYPLLCSPRRPFR